VVKVIRSSDLGATWARSTVDSAFGVGGKLSLQVVPTVPASPPTVMLTYWYLFTEPDYWGRAHLALSSDGGQVWSVWTIPDPGYVSPYIDAAAPSASVAFVSYQVADSVTGVAVLRVARISPVP
jgi:hypothetical protein